MGCERWLVMIFSHFNMRHAPEVLNLKVVFGFARTKVGMDIIFLIQVYFAGYSFENGNGDFKRYWIPPKI